MNALIGYGYHPWATATYMERALESRAATTFVGAPGASRAGFDATGDLNEVMSHLPQRPDLYLYVDSGEPRYFPRGLNRVACATACYLVDVHLRPRELAKQAMFFDYAFSAQRDFVEVLKSAGHPQAHWLPLACDPTVHRRYDRPKKYDIGFVGSVGRGYERRKALLRRLDARFALNDYTTPLEPPEMARLYSESRMVFNCSLDGEINMRAFEGPATGSMLLTDRIGNGLDQLFTDREHVVLYDDDSMLDVAEHFVHNGAERERIALSGRDHVLSHHTYSHRVDEILRVVFHGPKGMQLAAPVRKRREADVHVAYAELFSLMGRVDDTIQEFVKTPRRWRFRVPAVRHIALCLLRRGHYLLTV